MRIKGGDVLEMLPNGAPGSENLVDFLDLEPEDIHACLAYAVTQLDHQDGRSARSYAAAGA